MSFKHNDGRLDFADWLIKEGYGTPYRVRVEGFTDLNDHFMITSLSKSIMAVRLTYFTKLDSSITSEDRDLFGSKYYSSSRERDVNIGGMRLHRVDIEYLTETGWVRFVRFETRVLVEEVLKGVDKQRQSVHRSCLVKFEHKVKTLLDHVITFHGLTLL